MRVPKKIIQLLKDQSIVFSASLMLLLVVCNAGFLIYNNHVEEKSVATQEDAQEIKNLLNLMWDDVVRNLDLGLRGFALTKDEGLLYPYNVAKTAYVDCSQKLESRLSNQGYPDLEGLKKVEKAYESYIKVTDYMVELARMDSMDMFIQELKMDRGLALWRVYEKFAKEVNTQQDKLYGEAVSEYKSANRRMSYVQILLFIIGGPTLIFMIVRIVKGERSRKELFEELEKNNREYLFDPGTAVSVKNEREVINNSIRNFRNATHFISEISTGNLEVDWEELTEQNKPLNRNNLTGELIQMREKMIKLKEDDNRRMWGTEGEAKLSEIIRNNQHDLLRLCDEVISYLVKYLSAQQGSIFLFQDEADEKYLELKACYAFNRKKFVEKKVAIGAGLVGQVFLEQEPTKLTNVPPGYTFITSGLGEATPNCLILVPMKYNEKVEGVIEIAGFTIWEPHQLEWIDKMGVILASTLATLRNTEKTQVLLEQFKAQTQQLSAQEEELRQNMEEMEATQEEMRRKELELERRQVEMQELLNKQSTASRG